MFAARNGRGGTDDVLCVSAVEANEKFEKVLADSDLHLFADL